MSEQQPLLHSEGDLEDGGTQPLLQSEGNVEDDGTRVVNKSWRERTAEKLETKSFHVTVIALISIDSVLVLVDLSYSFLSNPCTPEASGPPLWLEILSNISLFITYLFLIELLLCIWAFGFKFYSPSQSILHFCDAFVIIITFVVDVVLKGRERELAALLILLRLIRFAAEAAIGVAELNEGTSEELHEARKILAEKTKALYEAQQEIQMLKLRLSASDGGA